MKFPTGFCGLTSRFSQALRLASQRFIGLSLALLWPAMLAGCLAAEIPAMPMPIVEEDGANYRWLHKPVLAARLLDNMETTNHWSHQGFGEMVFTSQRSKDGRQSVRLTSPTQSDQPNKVTGRPFGEAVVLRSFDGENWGDFNRLSFWVYPHLPGFRVISMLVRLHNNGAVKVPDGYGREGLNFFLLKPDQWNQVVWEIPHLARDRVTGIALVYRLQGNEPGATNVVCYDVDHLELQRVEPDHFEGWNVAPGKIAYSHSGYLLGGLKTALATGLSAKEFKVLDAKTKQPVLTRPVQRIKSFLAGGPSTPAPMSAAAASLAAEERIEFQCFDFSSIRQPGEYILQAGDVMTRPFSIGDDAWLNSIWKTISFFYSERCGAKIAGIHEVCHQDWQAEHNGKRLVINGGWHDAGDLSQGLVNTSEATQAMFALAERLRKKNPALAQRLLEEACWGLDWIHKTRFGDGYRVTWATMDYWTDGVVGNADDTLGSVGNSPSDNFYAATAAAIAARVLKTGNPILAEKSLRLAREDWRFAVEKLRSPGLETASIGALASVEMYKATGETNYAAKAFELAAIICQCQQREPVNWQIPLAGFFYASTNRDRILHYAHRGHEQAPIVALAELCQLFVGHADYAKWRAAVALHAGYLKRIAQCTEPYGMFPASVYALDESSDPRFREQVMNGIKLDAQHYLRLFPVWFDFRGNTGTGLSQTKALSAAARLLGDQDAAELVQKQLQWTAGRNPFCQSLMFGEGHDYAPQYTAMSGDLAGSLPVGIQTRENRDLPYWPAANCYNYKEVWVHPSSRWLAIMADVVEDPVP